MLARISRRLIKVHQYYTWQLLHEKKRKNTSNIDSNYYYQEFFIPTIAHLSNLTMTTYDHSNMDVGISKLSEDRIRQSLAKGKQIFHPVKHDSRLLTNSTQY